MGNLRCGEGCATVHGRAARATSQGIRTTRSRCGDDGAIASNVVMGRDRQQGSEVVMVRKGNVQGGGCKAAAVVLGVWGSRDLQHVVNPRGRRPLNVCLFTRPDH